MEKQTRRIDFIAYTYLSPNKHFCLVSLDVEANSCSFAAILGLVFVRINVISAALGAAAHITAKCLHRITCHSNNILVVPKLLESLREQTVGVHAAREQLLGSEIHANTAQRQKTQTHRKDSVHSRLKQKERMESEIMLS